MKHKFTFLSLFIIALSCISAKLNAQACLEIERILVDACAPNDQQEGLNEMLVFRTGDNPINAFSLNIAWASSLSFNGIVQNNSTVDKTAELNATITSCGYLIEPSNGDIPPFSRVLLITSFDVSSSNNSFTDLSDTLYVIYHAHPGPAGGHFLNFSFNNPLDQTVVITDPLNGCSETVTYLKTNLVDQSGGNTAQDGATVTFTDDGVPTYINTGCTAPVPVFSAAWTSPGTVCGDQLLNLNSYITGTQGGTWSGVGVTDSTFASAGLNGQISITYTVQPVASCDQLPVLSETHIITVVNSPDASWTSPGDQCESGTSIDLATLITGENGGTWSGSGTSGGFFNPSGLSGPVTVTYTIGAGICLDVISNTFNVINLQPLVIAGDSVYCNNDPVTALASDPQAGATVNWYTDIALTVLEGTGSSFTPDANQSVSYFAIQTLDGCTSEVSSISIEFNSVVAPQGDTIYQYCEGSLLPVMTVTSPGSINWYTDESLTEQVNNGLSFQAQAGQTDYYVTATEGACVSEPLRIVVVEEGIITAAITVTGGTSLCPGLPITLTSNALDINEWTGGTTQETLLVTTAGTYVLTREGFCNTALAEVEITGLPVSAIFTTDQDSGYVTLPVFVDQNSINAEECSWFLNDSAFDFPATSILNFTEPGDYVLKLKCSNSTGCVDSSSKTIKVISDILALEVPNVFSPNGDFINDLFQVNYNAVKTFNATVFNRWGKVLYQWDNVTTGWDGSFNGQKATDGVYFYVINGTDIKDVAFEEKGTVTLVGN